MHIKIDQSIKVEDPGDSVWAFANHKTFTLVMRAKVKRKALEILRATIKSRSRKVAKLKLFALGTFLLIEDFLPEINSILIDREYEGRSSESQIKGFVLEFIWKARPDFPKTALSFGKIPDGSPPDQLAYAVHKKQRPPDKVANIKDLHRVLTYKTKKK